MIEKILKKRGHSNPKKGASVINTFSMTYEEADLNEWLKDPEFRNAVADEWDKVSSDQSIRELISSQKELWGEDDPEEFNDWIVALKKLTQAQKELGRAYRSGNPRSVGKRVMDLAVNANLSMDAYGTNVAADPIIEASLELNPGKFLDWTRKKGLDPNRTWYTMHYYIL